MSSKTVARLAVIIGTVFIGVGIGGLSHSFIPFLLGEGFKTVISDIVTTVVGMALMNTGLRSLTGGDKN